MQLDVYELAERIEEVLEAIETEEQVTLLVDGKPAADIVRHDPRTR